MNLLDFANEEYINLITYKKDSSAVATPVWLSSVNDYLVITTSANAGKVKRVKGNGKATIYKTKTTPFFFCRALASVKTRASCCSKQEE